MGTLLQVKDLRTHFFTDEGVVRAVDGISYDLQEGETMGLVGESGCGKTVSALSILRLIPSRRARSWGARSSSMGKTSSRWTRRRSATSAATVSP